MSDKGRYPKNPALKTALDLFNGDLAINRLDPEDKKTWGWLGVPIKNGDDIFMFTTNKNEPYLWGHYQHENNRKGNRIRNKGPAIFSAIRNDQSMMKIYRSHTPHPIGDAGLPIADGSGNRYAFYNWNMDDALIPETSSTFGSIGDKTGFLSEWYGFRMGECPFSRGVREGNYSGNRNCRAEEWWIWADQGARDAHGIKGPEEEEISDTLHLNSNQMFFFQTYTNARRENRSIGLGDKSSGPDRNIHFEPGHVRNVEQEREWFAEHFSKHVRFHVFPTYQFGNLYYENACDDPQTEPLMESCDNIKEIMFDDFTGEWKKARVPIWNVFWIGNAGWTTFVDDGMAEGANQVLKEKDETYETDRSANTEGTDKYHWYLIQLIDDNEMIIQPIGNLTFYRPDRGSNGQRDGTDKWETVTRVEMDARSLPSTNYIDLLHHGRAVLVFLEFKLDISKDEDGVPGVKHHDFKIRDSDIAAYLDPKFYRTWLNPDTDLLAIWERESKKDRAMTKGDTYEGAWFQLQPCPVGVEDAKVWRMWYETQQGTGPHSTRQFISGSARSMECQYIPAEDDDVHCEGSWMTSFRTADWYDQDRDGKDGHDRCDEKEKELGNCGFGDADKLCQEGGKETEFCVEHGAFETYVVTQPKHNEGEDCKEGDLRLETGCKRYTDGLITCNDVGGGTVPTGTTPTGTTPTGTSQTGKDTADACDTQLKDKKWSELTETCLKTCDFGNTPYGSLTEGCKKHYYRWYYEEYKVWILGGVGVFVLLLVLMFLMMAM